MLICSIPGCQREVNARGLCRLHYERFRKTGDAQADKPSKKEFGHRPCIIPGCERRRVAQELCAVHIARKYNGKDLLAPVRPSFKRTSDVCSVPGCGGAYSAMGFCGPHYVRSRRGISFALPLRKKGKRRWTDNAGYIRVSNGNHYGIPEHRLVMQNIIGRPLLRTEVVHHRNGIRHDNRPENLEMWSKGHPSGQSVRDLLAWARRVISDYEPIEALLPQ